MADLTAMLQAAAGQAGAETDPNFNQTTLLLHGDGTNGAQNNTFLDSSTNNFTITRNGNTTQGTFSPFSVADGQWSNYFDGTDYLNWASNTAFVFGTGNFTIEAFVYATGLAASNTTIMGTAAASEANCCVIGTNGSKFLRVQNNSTAFITDSVAFPEHQWVHICAVRSGTTLSLYKNGVRVGTATNSTSFTSGTGPYVGGDSTLADFPGYISNARFVKGVAVYDPTQTTITVPTEPLTAISGTSLLTCQSSRFKDNSTNNFAVANFVGTPSIQPFSPFLPSAAYDPSVNGGSGYFDGGNNYLTFTKNTTSGAFTCECWFYRGANVTQHNIFTGSNIEVVGANNIQFIVTNTGGIGLTMNTVVISATGTAVTRDAWSHLVWVRNASNNVATFVNGNRISTATTSAPLNVVSIGAYFANHSPNGYVADARIVDEAVYDPTLTTLTVPTTPLTAVSNTYLLANFTNAGIFDNTGKNNLETVADAQIDTSVKKYGTGSMEFDGTGDYLVTPTSSNIQFGTGDYTVEMWIYKDSSGSGERGIFATQDSGIEGVSIWADGTTIYFEERPTAFSGVNRITGTISQNAFVHIAAVRYNGTFYGYVNGVSAGNTASSKNLTGSRVLVGNNPSTANPMKGYIDDLRITKGVARYTAAFTPPTAAFPDL
jgi:hypothetical protein